ncbi:hypothetical protein I4U23_009094 [Adineta vaga]|nr:hypothetical protein I4U23_009094 [Adineta vaga]
MCNLLKGSLLTKTMKTFPTLNNGNSLGLTTTTTPYTLICQILWLAYKDQTNWPDEFIEAYVEDALGDQNWIKNADCQLFVSNIQTAFHTRPCTWKLDRSKIFPSTPFSSTTSTPNTNVPISSTLNDETSNDSNANNESLSLNAAESESSLHTMEDSMVINNNTNNNTNNTDNHSIIPRYEGRSQSIQILLQNLLTNNAKIKATSGNSTTLIPPNTSTAASTSASQPHETDKLLYLLEHLCGLSEIRIYILSRLDVWLQNPKLNRTAERLMMTLCENLTKPSSINSNLLTNGHVNHNDTSYIDERAIEHLVNLRFKVRASGVTSKMHILCIREMLKNDANLVDIIVRFIIHNELQQVSSPSTTIITSKNPNNLPLLHACCQSQPEHTCQSLAYTIQNILLLTNVTTTSKDYENLLKLIRPFLRELMRYAKNDFDSMKFCMYLIDMHYSTNLQQQFWIMVQQQDPPRNDITSHRLLKRLLDCDMSTRERFLYAICDLIPMIILASAQAFNSQNNPVNSNVISTRSLSTINHEQWLLFIQRISFIQCSSCLFFLFTLPRLFDSTSTIQPTNYVTCLYSILFTNQANLYLRFENWPPEEPNGFRTELFRLSSDVPLLGETLYLLIQIGLTSQFRKNQSSIIELTDLIIRRTLHVEQKLPNEYQSIYLHLPENQCENFLKKFFDLTRYHIPMQFQVPPTYQIPKNLSITEMFWKTCLICLLLASHDPQTFGRFIWLSVPQIRFFMEMLLTGDYTYPPKSMIETKNFLEKFYHHERVQLREEKDLILELEKHLAVPILIDESNSQLLGKIITLDLQQIKRPTSQDKNEKTFYNLIQAMNNQYKLSSMLCRCRSPDFILDILDRKEQQGKGLLDCQTSWLTSLIDSNIDCLNVFPIICLCDYFQHMIMIYKNKNIRNLPSKKTLNALDTILIRFKSIIHTVKQQIQTNKQKTSYNSSPVDDMTCIFNYFLNCLNSNISTMRSNAWLCLYIILNDHSQMPNIENLLSKSDPIPEPNLELILTKISQFKSLEQIQSLIKQTLSETCHFETNIYFLHYSIIFIIDHCQLNSTSDLLLLANLARALNPYFDFNNQKTKNLHDLANLLQEFFLNTNSTPCFSTIKQINRPLPIKQNQEEKSSTDDNSEHFKQFAIEGSDRPENSRKRRLSHTNSSEKVFLTSSTKSIYYLVPMNNENEQSLFLSDDLQYFIFKSNNILLVKQCINQASLLTCLKMLKISVISHENINYLCQHVNQLIDSSSKQIHTYIKQSSFILPLINRWILEQLPEAIKLGEKLKKLLEKKKKLNSTTQDSSQQSELIQTTSRISFSILDQIQSFDLRINKLSDKTFSNGISNDNQMDISDTNITLPWKNLNECEELLRCLMKKNFDSIKRRQLLIQLQWLTNHSNEYYSQFFQTIFKSCQSTNQNEFLKDFSEQFNTSLVILDILMKNKSMNDEQMKLIHILDVSNIDEKSLIRIKLNEFKRIFEQSEHYKTPIKTNQITNQLTVDNMLDILSNYHSISDSRIERQFYKYLKLNSQYEDECKRTLMNVLIQAEHKLSEPTIGMILDQLEKMDYKSARSSNISIYANRLLFSQRTESSISQRLLLKQFLHSCDWSTVLNCISDLLTLPTSHSNTILSTNNSTHHHHQRLISTRSLKQSRCTLLNNRDSTLILDMLESFIKLSPLWSGREFKMLERCHDELLIDLNEEQIYTLILYILDEGDRRFLSNENLYEQYQKRYEIILYYLIKDSEKKRFFQHCLQKIFIDSETFSWLKDILPSFYFILYINQSDLFPENFYLILPNLFSQIKQQCKQLNFINTNYDYIIHDLLIRLNSYDLNFIDNSLEINLLLKYYVSKHPFLFLRHLNMIKLDLQSRLSTLTSEEFSRRNSKQRTFFLSLFDLIFRLKPYIYDHIYEQDLQAIIDVYIRLLITHLSSLNSCTKQNILSSNYLKDFIYLIDNLLELIYDYLYSTINNQQHYGLFRIYNNKFFEKIQEKLQLNKELYQFLMTNKHNRTLYHLSQLKVLYEAIRTDELTDSMNMITNDQVPFDVRLCLMNRSSLDNLSKLSLSNDSLQRQKSFDIQQYRMKLSLSIDESTSSIIIDDILLTLNELKSHIDHYLTNDHIELILNSLTNYLLHGNKQLMDQTYEFIFKYMEKYPQHSFIFYSTYMKCLLSTHSIVFQIAIEHFSHFMIYFQSKATELFQIILKQGLINKIDVTTSITQAIRLLNLHRYDPVTYTNLSSTMPSITAVPPTIVMTTTD